MPRPRAPTRELFQCTNRRRNGGKCVLYRCKLCGREMLENTNRFAVHVTVCKKASEKDRAIAIGQLLKTKKYKNNTLPLNEDDLMKKKDNKSPAARQKQRSSQQQQEEHHQASSPSAPIAAPSAAMARPARLLTTTKTLGAAKVPKINDESLMSPRAQCFQEDAAEVFHQQHSSRISLFRHDYGTPPLNRLDQPLMTAINHPNNCSAAPQRMPHLLPHSVPDDVQLEANNQSTVAVAGASVISRLTGANKFDSSRHHCQTPLLASFDTLVENSYSYYGADQQSTAVYEMGHRDDLFLCDSNQSYSDTHHCYWAGGGGVQDSLLPAYYYHYYHDEHNHQFCYPPENNCYPDYESAAWAAGCYY